VIVLNLIVNLEGHAVEKKGGKATTALARLKLIQANNRTEMIIVTWVGKGVLDLRRCSNFFLFKPTSTTCYLGANARLLAQQNRVQIF